MAELKKVDEINDARLQLESMSKDEESQEKFEDGFTFRTLIGALFVGLIMMPGAMYLGLVAGQGLGAAAQWVTIVLFSEIARRSFQPLKKQELYVLFYITGGLAGSGLLHLGLSGGPFAGLIWNQYLVQSPQVGELAELIPTWVAPKANDPCLVARTFLSQSWAIPIMLIVVNEVVGRMIWIGGGYLCFRMTSDVERLPFPMAPIAAAGSTALAESGTKEESWRWKVFSIGSVIGLFFGAIYVTVPVVTGVMLPKPVQIIPIPFIDLTQSTETFLPAAWMAISGDISNVLVGFVIPFNILFGQFISCIICKIFVNPILYNHGLLPSWTEGTPYLQTELATNIDFWMSVGIGTALGIGVIGLVTVFFTAMKMRKDLQRPTMKRSLPAGRGDWSLWVSFFAWLFGVLVQISITKWLVPDFPVWILLFYGLVYTPVITYVSGRMIGLTGMGVGIPYLREATIICSGYKGADIWFAGIPMIDLGGHAQKFREVELTGTSFRSIIKAEIAMLVILLISSFCFWSFFWKSGAIPSSQYPYAQRIWPVQATMTSIWWTANAGSMADNWLLRALKPSLIVWSGIGTLALWGVSSLFRVPLLFFYGFIGGIGASPVGIVPQFIGALFGKFYFAKRFGLVQWSSYAPILAAGFGCGVGLAGMAGIALAMIAKTVNYLPY